jgi:hypothetical protein
VTSRCNSPKPLTFVKDRTFLPARATNHCQRAFKEAAMRTAVTIVLVAAIGGAPLQASARGPSGASGMHASGGMTTGTATGPVSHGPVKLHPAPVPLTRRMTLNMGCYAARYRQLRNAGQDAGLASAGAALICG